jgi:hypothetical protein
MEHLRVILVPASVRSGMGADDVMHSPNSVRLKLICGAGWLTYL